MSELHSESPIAQDLLQQGSIVPQADAGAVMEALLQQLTAEDRQAIILRCDELPLLAIMPADLATLFASLLQLIFANKASVGQLYLHISCKAAEPLEAMSRPVYQILFATNLECIDPVQEYQRQMNHVGTILRNCGGSLAISLLKIKGCHFLLSLPGKTI